ncbi:MAG: NAD-dependent epimerase/dehydratase family protein [Anaerolineae bacterium]|nr:MAG: NAD-dependent epimerase/dehydratase family protein [Anaerolineae bacterium]
MARYLLAGAAGFIAARVADYLLADGHSIVGVDNLNDAYDVRMKHHRLERLRRQDGFIFHQLDIADKDAVLALAAEGPYDAVINLAARAGVRASLEDPWIYLATNTTGTLNLLELCRQHDIRKFVLASTSSIYGADAPLPTPETADSSHPLQPYAASKKGAETLCHSYHYLFGIDVTVVRYFTVYGPAGRPDMSMFRFAKWIAEGQPVLVNGDGEQTRGFTYVDDIARGTIQALKPVGYEVVNLGGHEQISINALIGMLEEILNKKANVQFGPFHKADMVANWADVSKAGALLGWEPQVGLRAGIQKMVDWYLENREWAKDIATD